MPKLTVPEAVKAVSEAAGFTGQDAEKFGVLLEKLVAEKQAKSLAISARPASAGGANVSVQFVDVTSREIEVVVRDFTTSQVSKSAYAKA